MKSHFHWPLVFLLGIAFIGCQDDITINNPEKTNSSLNKTVLVGNEVTMSVAPELIQVGDRIWKDLDKDGIQDLGEEGFPGITVCLFKCDSIWLNKCTITDANGKYSFSNLDPGFYQVKINIPAGWSLSQVNVGANDEIDSDIRADKYTECFELSTGEIDLTWDAGLYQTPVLLSQLGDRVWKDMDKDGIQDAGEEGFPGVTVALYACDGTWLNKVMNTDANGNYLFKDIQPGSYKLKMNIPDGWSLAPQNLGSNDAIDSDLGVDKFTDCFDLSSGEIDLTWDVGLYPTPPLKSQLGDRIWKDMDCNGIQGGGELGIVGVTVELWNCDLTSKLKTTITDANGNYLFTDIDAGCYKLKVLLPTGYSFSSQHQGSDDTKDSDVNQTTGVTDQINLVAGISDLTNDAGLCQLKGQLGDKVWNDRDKDGIQDSNEPGIKGVKVELYNCVVPSTKLKETETDINGKYQFTDLPAGNYTIKFITPAGYVLTMKDKGGNDAKDSDADTVTGLTTCITLGAGVADLNWDAGLLKK